MKITELKALSASELASKLIDFRVEQFSLKMHIGNGQIKTTHRLREMRKTIARIKTLLNEKQRG